MKKSFLLLPISVAVLSACSSSAPAPVESADGALPPGTMQPVDNNAGNTWEPQIQQQSMPATMSAPTAQPTYQAPQVQTPQVQAPQVAQVQRQTNQVQQQANQVVQQTKKNCD